MYNTSRKGVVGVQWPWPTQRMFFVRVDGRALVLDSVVVCSFLTPTAGGKKSQSDNIAYYNVELVAEEFDEYLGR